MTTAGTPMSSIEQSLFNYWLDRYEEVNGVPAPEGVAAAFERMVRLDDDEMDAALGSEGVGEEDARRDGP